VEYSKLLLEYGSPSREYLEGDEADISIEDHLDCQSNHKYRDGSLFIETKNGKSIKNILFELINECILLIFKRILFLKVNTLKKFSLFLPKSPS
jgi:hypothetical protein